jgi:hypothetical protein
MCKYKKESMIILIVGAFFLSGCSKKASLKGLLNRGEKEVEIDSGDKKSSGFDSLDRTPRYEIEERDGEKVKVYTKSAWVGNTFYSYKGNFSLTIPDTWEAMTGGQYLELFNRPISTMHLGVVDDTEKTSTEIGMSKINLRSSLVRIDNTHDRVAAQFEYDAEIGVYDRPTFLTHIELAGNDWYYFKVSQGGAERYYFGTCIEEEMYVMWVFYDGTYPVADILGMFGTLDILGEHLSPSNSGVRKQIHVSIPDQLPTEMPLRVLGLPPSYIPVDFQDEIREGVRPDGLNIPDEKDFKTHIAMQVDGTWLWDLTGSEVRVLSVAPFIKDGSTLVPIRVIAETLGAEVGWHRETQTVTLSINNRQDYDNNTISLVLDVLDPEHLTLGLDVPATRVGDTTFVPLRFVSEFLGAEVYWIGGEYRQIDIIV